VLKRLNSIDQEGMVPPPWAEMILIREKRFLAPVATMLVIMASRIKHEFDTEAFSH